MTDIFLLPYIPVIRRRHQYIIKQENLITDNQRVLLYDVADYHLFFGLHPLSGKKNLSDGENLSSDEDSTVSSSSGGKGWIFREWAPNATAVYIIGMMTEWKIDDRFKLFRTESLSDKGVWERTFPENSFQHGDLYRLKIFWENNDQDNAGNKGNREGDRIPTSATRVVQDPETLIFNAQVWNPESEYEWKHDCELKNCSQCQDSDSTERLSLSDPQEPLLIYEAHAGMAQEEGKIGTFREFQGNILPRIKEAGYNAIQLMAVQEHPYYGSFGYHVSNFFALSSRFGIPDDFKSLVDAAHGVGIKVIIDIVHSHAVSNEVEGLSRFDGSMTQFFHAGERGIHKLWGSRCFDYSKSMVIRFLLSNCRYWIEEFHVDGFRFDGITSMLYKDHGIERAFTGYNDYFGRPDDVVDDLDDFSDEGYKSRDINCNADDCFSNNNDQKYNREIEDAKKSSDEGNVDIDALCYLYFANKLIHQIIPDAVTIAEDVSGYPGLCAHHETGGIGFDYRFAMGISDFWIKLLKEYKDENWPLGKLWYELNSRRDDEKTISYAECHDQALVGDQTIMMRLMGAAIYSDMSIEYETPRTFRGVALHKMIRLITFATAGSGYLNFMGNEFGHPEWIDFPGVHNQWSYHFARRQWSLRDNDQLYFYLLAQFDKDMIQLTKRYPFMGLQRAELLHIHEDNNVIAFKRGIRHAKNAANGKRHTQNLVFIFNFNPLKSFQDYMIDAPPGKYHEVMNSDKVAYGGKGRLVAGQEHFTHYTFNRLSGDQNRLSLYLPSRSAIVLLEDNELVI